MSNESIFEQEAAESAKLRQKQREMEAERDRIGAMFGGPKPPEPAKKVPYEPDVEKFKAQQKAERDRQAREAAAAEFKAEVYEKQLSEALSDIVPPDPTLPLDLKGEMDYPIDTFIGTNQHFSIEISKAAQTPLEYSSNMIMSAYATVGSHLKISCEWKPGISEPLTWYFMTVGDPSEHKTTAINPIKAPMNKIQGEWKVKYDKDFADWAAILSTLDVTIEAAKAAFKKGKEKEETLNGLFKKRSDHEAAKPVLKMLCVGDITPEELATRLSENGGLGMMASEAQLLDNMGARYSDSPQIRHSLMYWSNESFPVNRRGREETVEGMLSMGFCCPTDTLQRLVTELSGCRSMGLLSRFGYSCPISRAGHRPFTDDCISEESRAIWEAQIRKALIYPHPQLILSKEAYGLLPAWHQEIEARMLKDLRLIRDWAGKLQIGQVIRLAMIYHLMEDNQSIEISKCEMEKAIKFARYMIQQAKKAFEAMEEGEEEKDIKRILDWAEGKPNHQFCQRQLNKFLRVDRKERTNEQTTPILNNMQEEGLIKPFGKEFRLIKLAAKPVELPALPERTRTELPINSETKNNLVKVESTTEGIGEL